jgi:hypothetical protein
LRRRIVNEHAGVIHLKGAKGTKARRVFCLRRYLPRQRALVLITIGLAGWLFRLLKCS